MCAGCLLLFSAEIIEVVKKRRGCREKAVLLGITSIFLKRRSHVCRRFYRKRPTPSEKDIAFDWRQRVLSAGGSGLALQVATASRKTWTFLPPNPLLLILASSLAAKVGRLEEILTEVQTLIVGLEGVKCSSFIMKFSDFRGGSSQDLKIADWRDIFAEKFKTLAQGGSKKDFMIFLGPAVKINILGRTVSIFRSGSNPRGESLPCSAKFSPILKTPTPSRIRRH